MLMVMMIMAIKDVGTTQVYMFVIWSFNRELTNFKRLPVDGWVVGQMGKARGLHKEMY